MRNITHIAGILLLSVLSLFAQAQDKKPPAIPITIQMENASVRDILTEIERQADVRFTYESTLLNDLPSITFTINAESLENCLKKLFLSLPIMYQQNGKYIILKKRPRNITISGFIRDKASSESLIGASVYDAATRQGTASNNHGFFSVRLNPGDIFLKASYIGYKGEDIAFKQLDRDTTLMIDLEPSASLQEVVVTASEREQQPVLSTQMGKLEINQKSIRMTPTMFGEADIVKTLQLTPGVAAGTEGFTGMYVRGGNGDDNLFLIDGNPVYQISHIGGLFSAFNAEAIRGMDFLKAGFPARYGGRLSSVIDVHTKEGNMKEFHGSASVGLISGGLSFEGPIIKDKTSFMFALRRTWLDVLTVPALAVVNSRIKKHGEKSRGRYSFHDLNLKLDHKLSERSRLFFSLYNGKDELRGGFKEWGTDAKRPPYIEDTHASLDWGNLLITGGWTHMFSNRLFGKVAGVFTQYNSTIKQSYDYEYGEKGTSGYEKLFNETSSTTGITDFGHHLISIRHKSIISALGLTQ